MKGCEFNTNGNCTKEGTAEECKYNNGRCCEDCPAVNNCPIKCECLEEE
jgi:hypothetical protein